MRVMLVCALLFVSNVALGAGASLQLTEDGVAALEQMLDVARKNVSTMREVDTAVSLYNALQQAKREKVKLDLQQQHVSEQVQRSLETELNALKEQLAKVPKTEPDK